MSSAFIPGSNHTFLVPALFVDAADGGTVVMDDNYFCRPARIVDVDQQARLIAGRATGPAVYLLR